MKEKSVLILHDGIKVRRSVKHGYGVFTDVEIIADTIIEECMVPMQVIEHGVEIIDGKEFATNNNTLNRYRYRGPGDRYYITPAGNAMIYNHSADANVYYEYNQEQRIMTFKALTHINAGQELFIDYGPEYAYENKIKDNTIVHKIV